MVERGVNQSNTCTPTAKQFDRTELLAESENSRGEPQWDVLALFKDFKQTKSITSTQAEQRHGVSVDERHKVEHRHEQPGDRRDRHGDRHERHGGRHGEKPDAKKDLKKDLPAEANLRDGDIIFVSNSNFEEGRAIQKVSNSPMTHCGILFKEGKEWFVYEAVQPVKKTPLKELHKPDSGETYAVRRLKDADSVLTKETLEKLRTAVKDQVGKDYDQLFGWGNDKMYCSELVWKAYYEATRQKVGHIKMVGDFDLSDPVVKKQVEARYGKNVPVTEPTITPGGIYESRLLKTVK